MTDLTELVCSLQQFNSFLINPTGFVIICWCLAICCHGHVDCTAL